MPKKLTILGALTAALVFGYLGLFNSTDVRAGGQTFVSEAPAAEAIDIVQCYGDSQTADQPVHANEVPPAITGRTTCGDDLGSPADPLPLGSAIFTWSVINIPTGNRLSLPTTFTPSAAGQWTYATVPSCDSEAGDEDANGECDFTLSDVADITSRTEIGCNTIRDVLGAAGGTGDPGNADGWGNEVNELETKWIMPTFGRLAIGPGLITAGSNSYIHGIAPFPSTWTFTASDLAVLNTLHLNYGAGATIPDTKLNLLTYEYAPTGLRASVALLGGSPDIPPNDSTTVCALQAPQDSITENNQLITPACAPGCRIPRWTTIQSDFDRADSTASFEDDDLARLIDWQCDVVGVPADGDDDGDCYPNAADPSDADVDNDNDLVPDGVEIAYGSLPADTDSDNDGCDDYCEIFGLTDPLVTDSDGDGQADRPDDTPTNCVGGCAGDDAATTGTDAVTLTDDNCPTNANASQLNTDSMFQFHGMGAGTGDATNPDEDVDGDACDTDADNDGIGGATENPGPNQMLIKPWLSPALGAVCVGFADAAGDDLNSVTNPGDVPAFDDVHGDADMDYILDGAECIFRSRPDAAIHTGAGNVTAQGTTMKCGAVVAVTGGGCTQLMAVVWAPGGDGDSDGLFMPGAAGLNSRIESQFRTQTFLQKDGTFLTPNSVIANDVDNDDAGGPCGAALGLANGTGEGDQDSDRDVKGLTCKTANLKDGLEVLIYGTFPADTDTDQDGCPDGDEVNDITGDGNTSSGDQGLMVSKFSLSPLDNAPANGKIDDYTTAMNTDLNKDGLISSGDQGLLAASISAAGNCTVAGAFAEDNLDITNYMNLP